MSEEKTVTRTVRVKVRFEGITPSEEQQKLAEGYIHANVNENLEKYKTISIEEVEIVNQLYQSKLFPLLKLNIKRDVEMGETDDNYCTIWYTVVCEDDRKDAISRMIAMTRNAICEEFVKKAVKENGETIAKKFCSEVTDLLIKNFKFDSKVFVVNTKFHPEDMTMTIDLETDDPILGPLFKQVNEMNKPQ